MWHELIAMGAVLLRPPFELPLERTLAISAVVSAPGKRTPLADRQFIHVGFIFHLIDSPTRNHGGKMVPAVHLNCIDGGISCQTISPVSDRSLPAHSFFLVD